MSYGDLFLANLVHADGTMLTKGQIGSLGDPAHFDRVGDGAWGGTRPGHDFGEGRQLGAEGVREAVHEEAVRRTAREGCPRLHGADRPALLHAGGDAVARSVELKSDVVPALVVARVRHDGERTGPQNENRRCAVHVAAFCEHGGTLVRTGGVNLDDVLAGDETDSVEV